MGEWGWRKAIVELPNDLDEYRLLFEGTYEPFRPPPSYPRNHVTIDNLEMRRCSSKGNLFMYALSEIVTGSRRVHFRKYSVIARVILISDEYEARVRFEAASTITP